MPTKTKLRPKKASQKEQAALEYQRFLETAKKLGADREPVTLGTILGRAVTPQRAKRKG